MKDIFHKFQVWPAAIICAAVFYFICFYKFRQPFQCGQSDMVDCTQYWANHLWFETFLNIAVLGTPALIGLFIARRYTTYLIVFLIAFAVWTFLVWRLSFGINGQNGCEACDFGMLGMAVFAYISLAISTIVVIARRRQAQQAELNLGSQ